MQKVITDARSNELLASWLLELNGHTLFIDSDPRSEPNEVANRAETLTTLHNNLEKLET